MVIKKSKESYGDLFIPMHDVSEKRKNLLLSLKNSLILQEEYEKIILIREKKAEILKTIKKGMSSLNSDYLKIKKHFPNVKNVLSNTEKEIDVLDSQITLLKHSNIQNDKDIEKRIGYEDAINNSSLKEEFLKGNDKLKSPVKIKLKPTPLVSKKPLTKKERVKANLKSIESKLNNL